MNFQVTINHQQQITPMNNLFIDPKEVIGRKFTGTDPSVEYTCVGYAANETFLLIGKLEDHGGQSFKLKTIRLADARFKM